MKHEKDPREQNVSPKFSRETSFKAVPNPSEETPEEAFKLYKSQLGLDEEFLIGKRILDVGSGQSKFEKYLEEKYPGTEVVSMDKRHIPRISVAGLAQQLPFKKLSFDIVVVHAVPLSTELKKSMQEYLEVLKVCGEIRIGPMFKSSVEEPAYFSEPRRALYAFLENLKGQSISVEDIEVTDSSVTHVILGQYYLLVKKLPKRG